MTLIFARHEAYMRARVKGKTLENISKKEISHLKWQLSGENVDVEGFFFLNWWQAIATRSSYFVTLI